MADDPIRWWAALTTEEVAALQADDPVAVLPLAAIEQHGPHLPLSTDLDIGLGLLAGAFRLLPPGFPAFALPPQAVGTSREHARFPGTLSLGPDVLGAVVEELGASLAGSGVRRLVLANSHGGNRAALDEAGLALRADHGLLVVKASWLRFPGPPAVGLPESEWRHGLHGGAVETAMMLHLRPDLVRGDRIVDGASLGQELAATLRHVAPEGAVSFAWLAGDLSAAGTTGDARRATAEMGSLLVAHYARILAETIQDARAFPLERLR